MINPKEFKRLITFYDTASVPNIATEQGGMTETLTNPRQEYGALYALNPMTVVNGVQDNIRESTHILTTRYRKDLTSFTDITTMILDNDMTTRTERYSVNDIQLVDQENRFLVCHLTLQELNFQGSVDATNPSQ
ncbi:phage head completion protein [Komagataeibacter nataicola]|uniref:phage head completion protein n=1 Tax=Komagataeibacter nataicola TaxID=265960 RepID=UPI0011B4ED4B|nr:hypothetical protein [Komagataeibacter nataicola]WNM07315.1 hypothetical protein RI056_00290 [Komagataeibacter nataicola]